MSTTLKWAGREYECFMSNNGLRVEYLGENILTHWPDDPTPPTTPKPAPPAPAVAPPAPKPPTTPPVGSGVRVNTANELYTALADALAGGPTYIIMAAGDYGNLRLSYKFTALVVVEADPGVMYAQLTLHICHNLTMIGLEFDYGRSFQSSHKAWHHLTEILWCKNVWLMGFRGVGVDAHATGVPIRDGFPTGEAFHTRFSKNCGIQDADLFGFSNGFKVDASNFISLINNTIDHTGHDGITVSESTNCKVIHNSIGEFYYHKDDGNHPDGIQFWSNAAPPLQHDNFEVSSNTIKIGNGDLYQQIFGRNLKDAQFIGNHIEGLHLHGISPGNCENVLIDANTLIQAGDQTRPLNKATGSVIVPSIVTRGLHGIVSITNNVTPTPITGIKPEWIASNNTVG